jgi:hypothetical protein
MVEPIDNRTLLRRTAVTVAAMVGGCTLIVCILTLIAMTIAGRAVAPNSDAETGRVATAGRAESGRGVTLGTQPFGPGTTAK